MQDCKSWGLVWGAIRGYSGILCGLTQSTEPPTSDRKYPNSGYIPFEGSPNLLKFVGLHYSPEYSQYSLIQTPYRGPYLYPLPLKDPFKGKLRVS